MKIISDSVNINFECFNSFEQKRDTILMLHGFTGSLDDWREIHRLLNPNFNYIGIDLVGHGKSDSPVIVDKYSPQALSKQINDLLNNLSIEQIIIVGYSMGGRAALSFAINHPNKIRGLILEGTTAGIESEKIRNERIKIDEELADYIESHNIEEFVELWMNKEIFNTQRRFSNEKLKNIRKKKTLNSKIGLANSLRGFGTGRMGYFGNKLNQINCPVMLITGELDIKFTKINSVLKKKFPNAKHKIIKNAGHNVHLEEPERFVTVINDFLLNM
ncbi:MAG: 2-succinyl-6-hydroxy-2,4-cyclohexadiene-1-carboxylate synthase [Bacteroidetes bacterium]|nr:2-succinyl-6-hydroxy-2,4-cyclohexadiene-1-carboxylate synthase [Bacteroidota bacterium]